MYVCTCVCTIYVCIYVYVVIFVLGRGGRGSVFTDIMFQYLYQDNLLRAVGQLLTFVSNFIAGEIQQVWCFESRNSTPKRIERA